MKDGKEHRYWSIAIETQPEFARTAKTSAIAETAGDEAVANARVVPTFW